MPITGLQLITVTGQYLYLDGTPAVGTVSFLNSTVLVNTVANEIVVPKFVTATLDATGRFSIALPATNDPDFTPLNFTYTVIEKIEGRLDRKYSISLPVDAVGSTIDLADVAAVPGATGTDTRVVYTAGSPQTISKVVTFTANPVFNDNGIPVAKVADVASQAELDAHAATPHAAAANPVSHDGTPTVGDWLRVKSLNPLVVERDPGVVRIVNVATATYTIVLGDAGKVVRMTFVGASTLTIPTNATAAFLVGTIINAYAAGGALTIAAAAGVTIRNNGTALAQYGEVSLRKDGPDEWVRVG